MRKFSTYKNKMEKRDVSMMFSSSHVFSELRSNAFAPLLIGSELWMDIETGLINILVLDNFFRNRNKSTIKSF